MHIALGKILNGWALIENQLATLMGVILQNSVGLMIYHCPNNFETATPKSSTGRFGLT